LQLLFLLANISYFVVLDVVRDCDLMIFGRFMVVKDVVSRSNSVAMDFGRALFGSVGGTTFAFMVAFSCFGALNGEPFFISVLLQILCLPHTR
jgi:hypothetical protein